MINSEKLVRLEKNLDFLYKGLKEEFFLYGKMVDLCEEEKAYIISGDIERLQKSLKIKQTYLEAVQKHEKRLNTVKQEWAECKDLLKHPLKEKIVLLINDFKNLIKNLVSAQNENERIMKECAEKEKVRLARLRKGKTMNNAYSAYGSNVPRAKYMDRVH